MKKIHNFIIIHEQDIISVLSLFIIVFCLGSISILCKVDRRENDVAALKNLIYHMSDVCDNTKDLDMYGELGKSELIRMCETYKSNPENQSKVEISTMDELNEFISKFATSYEVNDWVRCYIKYTAYQFAENSLNEDSEDYWHMKYVTSNAVSTYNYSILIKYKVEGFIVKYSNIIAFCELIIVIFVFVFWVFSNIKISNILKVLDEEE